MLSSDQPNERRAGFSLLEVLLVLAVLAVVTVAVAPSQLGPSDRLKLQQQASELNQRFSRARHLAIQSGHPQKIELGDQSCSGGIITVFLFSDGSASQGTICLEQRTEQLRFWVDPLIGQLSKEALL